MIASPHPTAACTKRFRNGLKGDQPLVAALMEELGVSARWGIPKKARSFPMGWHYTGKLEKGLAREILETHTVIQAALQGNPGFPKPSAVQSCSGLDVTRKGSWEPHQQGKTSWSCSWHRKYDLRCMQVDMSMSCRITAADHLPVCREMASTAADAV